jgi:tetratricopeptide (TPR) repeat protein
MQQELERRWQRAQADEARGDLAAARAEYTGILAIAPRQPMVRLRLSDIAERENRYRDARDDAIDAAHLVRDTRRWELLPFATLRLLAFDERDLVRDLILGADWSQPAVLAQSAVLSQHLWLIEDADSALRLLAAAMPRTRPHPLLHYSRANALRHAGRLDDATAEFEKTLALSPDDPYAHWSLAYHAKATPTGSRVARVRKALVAAREPFAQANLQYALFKELDDTDDTDAAWDALAAGARAMRALLQYDDARDAEGIAALQTLEAIPAPGTEAAPRSPIFIVGMPRTGTTVLERILGNHSHVASAGELNAFQHALSVAADRFVATPPTREDVEALRTVDADAIGADYLRRTERLYGDRTHLVDKNPLNVFNAGWIARALPQARILCLVRDPMDACFSNFKELFSSDTYGYSYDLRELAAHALRFRTLVAHWERTLPGRFMTVPYESLVAEPDATSAAVLAFCGLDTEAGVADITRNTTPSSTASSSQVREPIHARGVGAWRRYERQLAPLARALGQGGA